MYNEYFVYEYFGYSNWKYSIDAVAWRKIGHLTPTSPTRHKAPCGDSSKIFAMQIFKINHSEHLKVDIAHPQCDSHLSNNHLFYFFSKFVLVLANNWNVEPDLEQNM